MRHRVWDKAPANTTIAVVRSPKDHTDTSFCKPEFTFVIVWIEPVWIEPRIAAAGIPISTQARWQRALRTCVSYQHNYVQTPTQQSSFLEYFCLVNYRTQTVFYFANWLRSFLFVLNLLWTMLLSGVKKSEPFRNRQHATSMTTGWHRSRGSAYCCATRLRDSCTALLVWRIRPYLCVHLNPHDVDMLERLAKIILTHIPIDPNIQVQLLTCPFKDLRLCTASQKLIKLGFAKVSVCKSWSLLMRCKQKIYSLPLILAL